MIARKAPVFFGRLSSSFHALMTPYHGQRRIFVALVMLFVTGTVLVLAFLSSGLSPLREACPLPSSMKFADGIPACRAAADSLVNLGVRLLALDFDSTIIDIHTGGHWDGDVMQLSTHVRPEMQCLIGESLCRGVSVSVVTFSKQEDLIAQVLAKTMAPGSLSPITVYGGDNRSSKEGKRKQLARAADSIGLSNALLPSAILLVDDDEYNIKLALEDSHFAFLFDPNRPANIFQQLQDLSAPP